MRRIMLIAGIAGLLAGCAGSTDGLIVNRLNVSDAKYDRDIAACKQEGGVSLLGNPVAKCMTGKGYQVLMK